MRILIHQYTAKWQLGLFYLSHSIHERESDDEMNSFISEKIKDPYHSPTVFFCEIKKNCGNKEEAVIVEENQLMKLTGEDAMLAVNVIACMPINREKLIETINRKLYSQFIEKSEAEKPKRKKEEETNDCWQP